MLKHDKKEAAPQVERLTSVDQLKNTPIPEETHETVKGLFGGISIVKLLAFYNKYKDSWGPLLADLTELFRGGGSTTNPNFP